MHPAEGGCPVPMETMAGSPGALTSNSQGLLELRVRQIQNEQNIDLKSPLNFQNTNLSSREFRSLLNEQEEDAVAWREEGALHWGWGVHRWLSSPSPLVLKGLLWGPVLMSAPKRQCRDQEMIALGNLAHATARGNRNH